ncbi:MAG: response regulator, partial [Rhizobiales bacterium]|nr:response regulator [Hyphomicrobiales bacterium]
MRIVLADPSRTMLKIVTQMLESRGHEVCPFTDAVDALNCIKFDRRVDALITSAEPKSMTGVELCWEARLVAGGQRPIHIIMMSSDPNR